MPTEQTSPENNHEPRCRTAPDASRYPDPETRWPRESSLQWGSDPSFGYHGFSCPIGSWTEERLVRNLMRNMSCMCSSMNIDFNHSLDVSDYIADNLSQSPDFVPLNGLDVTSFEPQNNDPGSETPVSTSSSSTSGSEKREADTVLDETPKNGMAKPKRKRKCAQRPGQKLCHCRSEKKRREVVTKGYEDLSQLVPALGSHTFTRKYVLNETAKYIELLVQGNETLRRQLNVMKEQEERDTKELIMEFEAR